MKQMTSSKWLGAAAIVVGLFWFGFTIDNIAKGILENWSSFGFGLAMTGCYMGIMLLALFSIYFGARVLETPTKHRIRRTSGYLVALVAIYVAFDFPHRFLGGLDDRLASSLWMLGVTIAATCIHMFAGPAILRREGFQTLGYREFISKIALFLIAIQIWMLGNRLADRFVPADLGLSGDPSFFWESIQVWGPIILAWGFYRIAVRCVPNGTRRQFGNVAAQGR